MPSNAELIATATELAAELELDITTDGLNNGQLVDLVKDLRAKKTDADNDTKADDAEDEVTKAAMAKAAARKAGKLPAKKKPPYYVAPRCSITSKVGILSGDTEDEVKPEQLEGGRAAFEALIESGHILKG